MSRPPRHPTAGPSAAARARLDQNRSMSAQQLSRRSFLTSGLVVAGGALAGGVAGAAPGRAPAAAHVGSPGDALRQLQAGNRRFVAGKAKGPGNTTVRRAELAEGQEPSTIVIACADSRVPPEIVFDQGLGKLFTVRVAGNTAADPLVVGSVEYAATVLNSVLIVVLGHDDCGAVKAAVDVATKGTVLPGELPAVVQPILPTVETVGNLPADQLVQAVIVQNVHQAVGALAGQPALSDLVAAERLRIVGAEYRLHSGVVELLS